MSSPQFSLNQIGKERAGVQKSMNDTKSHINRFDEKRNYRLLTKDELERCDDGARQLFELTGLPISEADALPIPNRRARLHRSILLTLE